ncbi:MAG: tetratricopeptide repeat protein [Bacteroidales bacterium]|jgi:Tfp pilus assembly protein PilF
MNKRLSFIILLLISLFVLSCKNKKNNSSEEQILQQYDVTDLNVLDSLIAVDSTNGDLFSLRADLLYSKGRYPEAFGDISNALQIKGNNISDLLILSDIYFAMGKPSFAREALRKAESIDNTDYTVYYALGRHHLLNGNFVLAKGNFLKSIELKPNPESYFQLGYMSLLNNDTTDAINNFQKSIQIDNQYYNGYLQLAVIYMDKDRTYVPEYLQNAINSNLYAFEALHLFGIYNQEEGNFRDAVNYFEKSFKVDSTNQYSAFNIGYIYLTEFNVFDTAQYWFGKALEIDSTFKEAKHNYDYCIELQK